MFDQSPIDGADFYLQYDKDGVPYDLCRQCNQLTRRDKLTGGLDDWTCPDCTTTEA